MYWASALALLSLHGAGATPTPPRALFERADSSLFELSDVEATSQAAELKTAEHSFSLSAVGKSPKSSLELLGDRATGSSPLKAVEGGAGYGISATLGSQVLELIFDTGSSDLWAPKSTFKCVTAAGKQVAQSKCDFGKTFSGTFQDGAISNENFNITYGDGEFAHGTFGYENVKIGNVTVDKQKMALADEAYFVAEGVDGLFGFAYPALTSAYPGTNPDKDTNSNEILYNPWITNAIAQKKFAPMFSLALERGATGGTSYLSLGGLPSISFTHTFATTPLKKIEYTRPVEKTKYSYYTIIPEGVDIDGKTTGTTAPMIVDSGTTLMYLPVKVAEAINAAFDPPSKLVTSEGDIFENKCDAKPPAVGIKIGGTVFKINAADLLPNKKLSYDPSTGLCVTGVQASDGPYILGDIFLKNVVAVYDIGASEMKFAPHENY